MANRLRLFFFALFVPYGVFLPFFPTWLAGRGIGGLSLSVLMSFLPALGVIGPPIFGALSDWLGLRSGLLRWTTAVGTGAMVLLAAAALRGNEPPLWVLFLSVFLLAASRAPSVAMADVIAVEATKPTEERPKPTSYGSIRLWGSIGFLVAATAGPMLDMTARAPFPLFLAVTMACVFALSFTFEAPAPPRAPALGAPLWALLKRRPFAMLLVAAFLGFGAHVSYDLCFSLHLTKLGANMRWIGVGWSIGTFSEALLMAFSGRFLSKIEPSKLLIVAFAGGAIRWLLIATIKNTSVLTALQPLHAISFALFWVTAMEHVKRLSPREILGSAQGVFNAAVGAGAVAGMFVWRSIFEAHGGARTFAWAALAAFGAAVAAAFTRVEVSSHMVLPGSGQARTARQ
ncbi:MAG: MFS transporter [Polyangiaceae bacterium]|nr:MFS transporter [Polyangiaceae bacterium]